MIPMKLTMQAFGPFRDTQTVDFTKFQDNRLFLICGKTGSGKTTIFDAITFSLFGKASGTTRDTENFKSQFADADVPCFAQFEFCIHGKHYTVYREPAQEKLRRGGNVTKEAAKATLTMEDESVISGITAVDAKIEELLGITCDQFRKIVMLPQGEFRRFLSDDSVKKQEILRRIFGTDIFNDFTENLRQQAATLKAGLDGSATSIAAYRNSLQLDADATALDFINDSTHAFAVIQSEKEAVEASLAELQEALRAKKAEKEKINLPLARDINARIAQLSLAKKQQAELLQQNDAFVSLAQKIKKLNSVKELILLKNAQAAFLSEQKRFETELQNNSDEIEKSKHAFLQEAFVFENAKKEYSLLDTLSDEIEAIKQDAERYKAICAEEKKHAAYKAEYAACLAESAEAKRLYQKALLQEENVALTAYQTLLAQMQAAKSDYAICDAAYRTAFHDFLDGRAYSLSVTLEENAPCPVCGSTVHPSKAAKPEREIAEPKLKELEQKLSKAASLVKVLQSKLEASDFAKTYHAQTEPVQKRLAELRLQLNADSLKLQKTSAQYAQLLQDCNLSLAGLTQRISASEDSITALKSKIKTAIPNHAIEAALSAQTKKMQEIKIAYETARQSTERITADLRVLDEAKKRITAAIGENNEKLLLSKKQFESALSHYALSAEEFLSLSADYENLDFYVRKQTDYQTKKEQLHSTITTLSESLKDKEPVDLIALTAQYDALTAQINTAEAKGKDLTAILKNNVRITALIQSETEKTSAILKKYTDIQYLFDVSNGKYSDRINFERYILANYFESVVSRANLRLEILSDSRYTLERMETKEKGNKSSGLGLCVFDSHTGKARHVNTLSGGESFIVSLALALGLADKISEISGGVELNTMFVDEGFGSLDVQTVDDAIECLKTLQDGGRYIGIISHVSELKERIPQKIVVSSSNAGSIIHEEGI